MRYYYPPPRMSVIKKTITSTGEYTERSKLSCLLLGMQRSYFGKQYQFLKWFNTELSYDPVTPFLAIQPGETKTYIHTKICMRMFIVALVIITKK